MLQLPLKFLKNKKQQKTKINELTLASFYWHGVKTWLCSAVLHHFALIGFSKGERQTHSPSRKVCVLFWVQHPTDFGASLIRSPDAVDSRLQRRGCTGRYGAMPRQPDWIHTVAVEFCWAGSCHRTQNLPSDQLHHWRIYTPPNTHTLLVGTVEHRCIISSWECWWFCTFNSFSHQCTGAHAVFQISQATIYSS